MSPRSLVRYEEVRRRGKDPAVQESDAPYAEGRYFDANCQATNVVNDCVHVVAEVGGIPSVDLSDPALSVTMPAIGIIVRKYTSTTCIVQHTGEITTISGLIPGLWYFVGPTGQPSITPPPLGFVRQLFGYVVGESKLLLTPNFMADSSLFGPSDILPALCSAAESIGDMVYVFGDMSGGRYQVRKADPTEFSKMPAWAVIVNKSSATECAVQWNGIVTGVYSGLTIGKPYWVGVLGAPSLTLPSGPGNFIQSVGIAVASDRLLLSVQPLMTRLAS